MKCFYINLDTAATRKLNIENNFLEHSTEKWSLTRFPAIDVDYVKNNKVTGSLRNAEKACFLSHKFVIKKNLNAKEPVLIMEDDAVIGKSTCEVLTNIINIGNQFDWDILFTDVIVPQPTTMVELINLRKNLSTNNQTQILNLANFIFGGATSYVLNPKSIGKIFHFLDSKNSLDIPYDLYLRQLISENKLKGFVTFPFITTLSNESDASQIQISDTENTDLVWNTFRKMIWIDRKSEDFQSLLEKINKDVCDEESRQFGTIISACLSNKFISK